MFRTHASFVALVLSGLFTAVSSSFCAAQYASRQPGVTVLFFHSQDCQPCRQMEPLLIGYQQSGWDIRPVDAPQHLEIARQFNIQNLPTLVFLRDGKEADRVVGAVSPQQLGERLNRFATKTPSSALSHPNLSQPNSDSDLVSAPPSASGTSGSSMIVRGQSPATLASSTLNAGFPMLATQASKSFASQPPATISNQQPKPQPKPLIEQSASGAAISTSDQSISETQAAQRAADATVRIKVEESNTTAHGTGTIVATHDQEALVLTCGHLFRDMLPGSHLKVDLFAGTPRQTTVLAQLIDFKADKEDIGLLSVRLPVAIEPVPILPIGEPVQVGQPVFSMGCDHGNNPTRRDTRITHVNRYLGPHNVEIEGAPAVGRSGGGLFDLRGRLIGVCNAACNQDNEGIYASAGVLYEQLARVDHAHLFQQATGKDQSLIASPKQPPQPAQLASASGSSDIVWPDDSQSKLSQTEPSQNKTHQFSQQTQSPPAYSHTSEDSNGVQVICIVRTPGSGERVVRIDRAPAQLISAIEEYSADATKQ